MNTPVCKKSNMHTHVTDFLLHLEQPQLIYGYNVLSVSTFLSVYKIIFKCFTEKRDNVLKIMVVIKQSTFFAMAMFRKEKMT